LAELVDVIESARSASDALPASSSSAFAPESAAVALSPDPSPPPQPVRVTSTAAIAMMDAHLERHLGARGVARFGEFMAV
jgi:hypothetical protein